MFALREDRGDPGIPRVPPYFLGVARIYLRNRSITYTDRGGEVVSKVPQRSVLGPLLWELVYDGVLQTPMPPDSVLTCYPEVTCVASIRGLELELSLMKTNHGASPA